MAAVRTAVSAPGRLTVEMAGARPTVITLTAGRVLPATATLAASRCRCAMRGRIPATSATTNTLPPSAPFTQRRRVARG